MDNNRNNSALKNFVVRKLNRLAFINGLYFIVIYTGTGLNKKFSLAQKTFPTLC